MMDNKANVEAITDVVIWKRMRYVITFMISFAIFSGFCARTSLSIAIVAMTDNSTNTDFETFDWSFSTRNTVLSSFFWGYVVTNIPAGFLVQKYGTRWILFSALLICTIATYLIPEVAKAGGWQALCALRVIQGLTQGTIFPSMNALLAKWAPAPERGRLGSLCFAGIQAGNILTLPVGGVLAASNGGWPSVFYVFASITVAWCILWLLLGYNSPEDHPYISTQEKQYIESFYSEQAKKASFNTPLKSIVLSPPFWAILISHCVQNWGYYMLLNEMPTYMSRILKYDIAENGALAALPYLVMFLLIFFFGWIADLLTGKKILRLVWSRKLFNSIGFLCPMATMIGLSYVGEQEKDLAVALLVLSAGLNAGVYVGFQVNHVDLAPNFAGTLMGITNAISNCVSLIVPLAIAGLVEDEYSEDQWHTVFWITAGVYLVGSIIYLLFGSADVQPWNERKKEKEDTSDDIIKIRF